MPASLPKYRAFLSYSHADTAMAKRVHAALETYHIDKDLVGRETPRGIVPRTLRPIFRDRQDFEAGADLARQTVEALDDSAALIVLASPNAARSRYVNEEVRLFRQHHADRPVVPLIVGGLPGGGEDECFPVALRHVVLESGQLDTAETDVLAADLLDSGDGFGLALAKVVARLLGLSPDDVYRRAERERRRRLRQRVAIAAAFVLVVLAGGGFYWQSRERQASLDEVSALVAQYSPVGSAEAAELGAKRSLTEALTAIVDGAETDPRYAQALDLLKHGKAAAAEPLLKAVAEDKAARADRDAAAGAAAYRNLASIAAVSDHKRAREYYAQATKLDPKDVESRLESARLESEAGSYDAAELQLRQVLALSPGDSEAHCRADLLMGAINKLRRNFPAARANGDEAVSIANRLLAVAPNDQILQRDLARAYFVSGSVSRAQGDNAAALVELRRALPLMERLAVPVDASAQNDLGNLLYLIGMTSFDENDFPQALQALGRSSGIFEALTKTNADNLEFRHRLALDYGVSGSVLKARGDLAGALDDFQSALAIDRTLTQSDPGNASWQKHLIETSAEIAEILAAKSNFTDAVNAARTAETTAKDLGKSTPNKDSQYELGFASMTLGNVLRKSGDLSGALDAYRQAATIAEAFLKADPGDQASRRNLVATNVLATNVMVAQGHVSAAAALNGNVMAMLGELPAGEGGASNAYDQAALAEATATSADILTAEGKLQQAIDTYQRTIAIDEKLIAADPADMGNQIDLVVYREALGDAEFLKRDVKAALAAYGGSIDSADRLAKTEPTNTDWRHDLAGLYGKASSASLKFGDVNGAATACQTETQIATDMVRSFPENPQFQQDLAESYEHTGDIAVTQAGPADALRDYQSGFAIAERLAKRDPTNLAWQLDAQHISTKIGDMLSKQGDVSGAVAAYQTGLESAQRLAALDANSVFRHQELARLQAVVTRFRRQTKT